MKTCRTPDCLNEKAKGRTVCLPCKKLKEKYGITAPDRDKMLEEQDHKCKICGLRLITGSNDTSNPSIAVVDHCHTTGKIRGMLCHRCNCGLGYFYDNSEVLQSAARYLKEVK